MSSVEMVAGLHAPVVSRVRYHGVFLRQFLSEIAIIFRRRRNLAILAVLGAVPIFIGVAVKISAPRGAARTGIHRSDHEQRTVPGVRRLDAVPPRVSCQSPSRSSLAMRSRARRTPELFATC